MKALLTLLFFYFATGAVLADDKSGPGRTTLRTFDGGTIYVVEKEATSAKAAPGEVTVKTIKAGKILVKTMPCSPLDNSRPPPHLQEKALAASTPCFCSRSLKNFNSLAFSVALTL